MKIKITALILSLFMGFTTFSSFKRDPNNPPVGSTGAPSEQTCNYAGCHTNGTIIATVSVTGLPDSVVANQTYSITLTVNSTNGARAGFQMTCLDNTNAPCGTFTGNTAVSIGTGTGVLLNRKYPRQAKPINFAAGVAAWTYTWKAPASLTNNKITFYYIGMASNADGHERLDNSFTGQKVVYLKLPTPTQEAENVLKLLIFPNPTQDLLYVELMDKLTADLILTDVQGKQVLKTTVSGRHQPVSIKHLPKGIYTATVEADSKKVSKQIVIQ